MKILPIIYLFLAFFCATTAAQETSVSERISTSLEKYTSTFPQEKLYLHFDKEYYSPGDTIWFKSYQVNASSHEPDSVSKIVYVDLIGPKNIILSQLRLKSKSGFAHADISLADTLQPGSYSVRAYTNWMRNFDSAFFFTKSIQLYAPGFPFPSGSVKTQTVLDQKAQIASDTSSAQKIQIDLQFFPEGGYLVNGLPAKVAFKAISASGKGLKVAGSIVDNQGNQVTSFVGNSLGMGVFNLLPQRDKQYFAQLDRAGLAKRRFSLPEIMKEGYSLSLNYFKPGYIRVNARTNTNSGTLTSQSKVMTLVGQCRGEVYFTAEADISKKGYFFIDVPKEDFPTGIVQFTLFDDKNTPQSERLAFINHQDNLKIQINTNKKSYAPREKVELEIEVKDGSDDPVSANLSLSVTDANQVPEMDSLRGNILTNLLLTSDLKGHIERPQTYFRDTTKETQQSLDLLMLTHGWRRFAWKEVLSDSISLPKFAAEKELSFSGSLANRNKAIEENRLTLMLMSTPPQVLQSPIAKNQDFYFGLPDFQDSVGVVLQTTNAKGKQREMQVSVDETQPPDVTVNSVDYENDILEAIKTALTQRETTINPRKKNEPNVVLDQVVIKKKIQGNMVGFMPGQKIDVEAVEKSMNFDYINVFYLIAAQGKGVFQVDGDWLVAGMGRNRHYPIFLINGVERIPQTPQYDFVKDVEIKRIKYLEIGEKFLLVGSEGRFVKYIIINTYQDGYRRSYPAGINTFKVAGFSKVREFYSPQYQLPTNIKTDDNRSIIYWNPTVKTDKNGKAKLTFYNSDKAKNFLISAEGISEDGNICATQQHLNR